MVEYHKLALDINPQVKHHHSAESVAGQFGHSYDFGNANNARTFYGKLEPHDGQGIWNLKTTGNHVEFDTLDVNYRIPRNESLASRVLESLSPKSYRERHTGFNGGIYNLPKVGFNDSHVNDIMSATKQAKEVSVMMPHKFGDRRVMRVNHGNEGFSYRLEGVKIPHDHEYYEAVHNQRPKPHGDETARKFIKSVITQAYEQ